MFTVFDTANTAGRGPRAEGRGRDRVGRRRPARAGAPRGRV